MCDSLLLEKERERVREREREMERQRGGERERERVFFGFLCVDFVVCFEWVTPYCAVSFLS